MRKKLLHKEQYSFFKKLFIKISRKIGFEVIDQSRFFVPSSNLKLNDNLSVFNQKNITFPLGELKVTRKIDSFLVIFRSFTNENKLLSQNKKRIFEKKKKEYTYKSLQSLCNSINKCQKKIPNIEFFLKVIDDNSSSAVVNNLKKIIKKYKIKNEISSLDIAKYESKMKFKNNKRMVAHNAHIFDSKLYAKNSNYDLIFFVEDDYLHQNNSITEMIYSYQKLSTILNDEIILCPADYPYLYNNLENTVIFAGQDRHWRKVKESLCTYLISKKLLLKNWKEYESMMTNNFNPYEKPLHKIYKKFNCFSPMPSLSTHMTNVNSIYGISPFTNVLKIWKSTR